MKRVRRLYIGWKALQLRHRVRRRKHASLHRGIPPAASRSHEPLEHGFVHDGAVLWPRRFVLTVGPIVIAGVRSLEVVPTVVRRRSADLDRAIAEHGQPRRITVDMATARSSLRACSLSGRTNGEFYLSSYAPESLPKRFIASFNVQAADEF